MKILILPYTNGQARLTLTPETEAETAQLEWVAKELDVCRIKFDVVRQWNIINLAITVDGKKNELPISRSGCKNS